MCWLAKFSDSPCRLRADGNYDRAHLIPQQRLVREYRTRGYSAAAMEFAVWDRRVFVPACRQHHHEFDVSKTIRLEADDYPPELHEYADEYCWFFLSASGGWRVDRQRYEGAEAA